jgi:hypothetical protein
MLGLFYETPSIMKAVITFLFLTPFMGMAQYSTVLELNMHDYSKFVVYLDTVEYDVCDQISINALKPGAHQLRVYKQKHYFNSSDNSLSIRLISVYDGKVTLVENKCTTCIIDKFHQTNTVIR